MSNSAIDELVKPAKVDTDSEPKPEKPKPLDFRKRAEEMEKEHLKVIKAEAQEPAPEFSVSQVIQAISRKSVPLIKEELGSDSDVHLKGDLRMNMTLDLESNKTTPAAIDKAKKEDKN